MAVHDIHLACIAEGDFLRHSAAMLHSAMSHLPSDMVTVTVHLLHQAPIAADDKQRLQHLMDQFSARLHCVQLRDEDVCDFPQAYFHRSVWFRVLLPDLLPELERVLYLDSDLIVVDDLYPLWQTDTGSAPLAAVVNPFYPYMPRYPVERLGFENMQDYFNSGVLLMNLERMRQLECSRVMREYAQQFPRRDYPDQDALNAVCQNQWFRLHPRWNVQTPMLELKPEQLPIDTKQLSELRSKPAVVHFIGPFKPWQYLCRHPMQGRYFEHARQTEWGAPTTLEGRGLKNFFLRRMSVHWIDRVLRWERNTKRWIRRRKRGWRVSRL